MMKLLALLTVLCASSVAIAGDPSQPGTVTFAFDGGTLKCTFGTRDRSTKPMVAMIVYPASVPILAEKAAFIPNTDTKGSTVLTIDADGKHIQLDVRTTMTWAKARAAEMAIRRSSVAENGFLAAVVHTIYTGEPVHVWASAGQDALESGHWTKLFDPKPRQADPFGDSSDANPFD